MNGHVTERSPEKRDEPKKTNRKLKEMAAKSNGNGYIQRLSRAAHSANRSAPAALRPFIGANVTRPHLSKISTPIKLYKNV